MDNMIYRGHPELVHIDDGKRSFAGEEVAAHLTVQMRRHASGRTLQQRALQKLCPGCYMVALFDAAIAMADQNGQSRKELALSMANAFTKLVVNPQGGMTEEIQVILDPDCLVE